MRASHALIVDDSKTIRTILSSQLEQLGFDLLREHFRIGEEEVSEQSRGPLVDLARQKE